MFTKTNATTWTADEDLYLAADGTTIVHAGDWRAAILLAKAGGDIPPKLVERLKLSDGTTVAPLVKDPPKPEQTAAAKAEYDKQVAAAAVAYRKKDVPGAIAAYETAAKITNLEPTHQADARAQIKSLKTQLEGEKAHVVSKTGTVSSEEIANRSTRPEKPTDVR